MRNRSTRVIVGLLLVTGLATSQLKQAGLLTGQVVPTLSCTNASTTLTFSEGSPSLVPATMESFPRYGTNNNPPHYAPFPYSNPPSYQSAGVRISVDPVVARWVYVAAGLPPKAAGAAAPASPGGTLLSTIMQSGTSTGTPTELPALTTTITFVNPSSGAAATALGSSISMWVYSQAGTVNLKSFDAAGVLLEQKTAPASTTVQFATGNVARIELVSNYPAGGVAIDNLQYTLNLTCTPVTPTVSCAAPTAQLTFSEGGYAQVTTGIPYYNTPMTAPSGGTIITTQFRSAGVQFGTTSNQQSWVYLASKPDPSGTSVVSPGGGPVLSSIILGPSQSTTTVKTIITFVKSSDGSQATAKGSSISFWAYGRGAGPLTFTSYDSANNALETKVIDSANTTQQYGTVQFTTGDVSRIEAVNTAMPWQGLSIDDLSYAINATDCPAFYATGPGNSTSDANGVIQVPSGSTIQLISEFGTGNCNPFSSLGSANWDGNHRTHDWPQSGLLVPAPCTRTVSIPNITQSQTFYLDVGMARTNIQRVSVVVQPAAGPIAGIGGAPAGTFRAFGPSGQVSVNGSISVPSGSPLILEWNKGEGACNTYSTNGSPNWDGGKTYATWQQGAAEYFNNYCSGIVTIPSITSTQTFSMDVGNARTTIATLTANVGSSVDLKVNGQDGTISVLPNTPVTLTWTSNNVVSCDTGTAPAPWGPNKAIATSGSQQYTPTTSHTIGIQCTSVGGTNRDVQDNVAMVILPASRCEQTDPFYCGTQGCPDGLLAYGSHVYLRYDTPAGSWQNARTQCQAAGGDLVSINDAQEQTAVYNALVGTGRHDVWIGLNDLETEGVFKWPDGTSPSYANWYTGNPDDGYSNEDCVEMNYKNHPQTGKWNDFKCSDGEGDNTGFICELPLNCGSASTACGVSEFYAQDGSFEAQGWTSVNDSDAATTLTGPTTENGVTYVRLSDVSTTTGMRTSDLDITNAMLADRDWSLEIKSRTVMSDPNGYVLGMNMVLVTPDEVSTSLFIEPTKFGLQAATPNAYTWGPSVSRNTSDAFHTYIIKNKKNAAGASNDTIDVYFDGAKVLSDIPRSQLYVYDPGTGVQGISFGIGSSPGKGTMDVSYVKFKNDESTCPANPFKAVTVQCSDGIDNDSDGKIDYGVPQTLSSWGPVTPSMMTTGSGLGPAVTLATGLQAGQTLKLDPIAGSFTNGIPCSTYMTTGSQIYFRGEFRNAAGAYVQPVEGGLYFPLWSGNSTTVPVGATQLIAYGLTKLTYGGNCSLSGTVQQASTFDADCSSASDDSEAGIVCTDSDGGNSPLQKGFANATGGSVTTGTDSCNTDGTLKEYFCDPKNGIQSTIATCESGYSCVDGACKAGSSSAASVTLNPTRTGFGGIAFDGNDILFMPLKNGDAAYHGNVLSFGPVCKPGACGDGVPTSDEQCDDGNTTSGDGCSEKCIWEPYAVTAASSSSSSRSSSSVSSSSSSSSSSRSSSSVATGCGDSIITPPEKCDDGNKIGGDGCSAFCQIETGWQCTPRLP